MYMYMYMYNVCNEELMVYTAKWGSGRSYVHAYTWLYVDSRDLDRSSEFRVGHFVNAYIYIVATLART